MGSGKNFIIRPPEKGDLSGVIKLFNAYSLQVIGEQDEDAATLGMVWSSPGINLAEDFRVALDKKNNIAAYLQIIRNTRPMVPFLDLYVSPDYWDSSLGEELFTWGEGRILELMDSEDVPGDARYLIQAASYSEDPYYKNLLKSRGLTLERVQWRMEKSLDSPMPDKHPLPEGVEIKTARGMSDLSPILRVFREVWKDHWGYVEKPFEDHYSRWIHFWQGEGLFDPDLWLIAWKGDRIVGFSLCKGSHGGDDSLGWVQSLGVLREYRSKGLGFFLLLHSFQMLEKRGKTRVGLAVDSDSLTGATRLYEKAGMSIVRSVEVYEKELRPGKEYRKE